MITNLFLGAMCGHIHKGGKTFMNKQKFLKLKANLVKAFTWILNSLNNWVSNSKLMKKVPKIKTVLLKFIRWAKNGLSKSKSLNIVHPKIAKQLAEDAQNIKKQMDNIRNQIDDEIWETEDDDFEIDEGNFEEYSKYVADSLGGDDISEQEEKDLFDDF